MKFPWCLDDLSPFFYVICSMFSTLNPIQTHETMKHPITIIVYIYIYLVCGYYPLSLYPIYILYITIYIYTIFHGFSHGFYSSSLKNLPGLPEISPVPGLRGSKNTTSF